jgi:hypothetical protein
MRCAVRSQRAKAKAGLEDFADELEHLARTILPICLHGFRIARWLPPDATALCLD